MTGGARCRIDPMRGGDRRRGPGGRRGSSASTLAFPAEKSPRRWGGEWKAGTNERHARRVPCREKRPRRRRRPGEAGMQGRSQARGHEKMTIQENTGGRGGSRFEHFCNLTRRRTAVQRTPPPEFWAGELPGLTGPDAGKMLEKWQDVPQIPAPFGRCLRWIMPGLTAPDERFQLRRRCPPPSPRPGPRGPGDGCHKPASRLGGARAGRRERAGKLSLRPRLGGPFRVGEDPADGRSADRRRSRDG